MRDADRGAAAQFGGVGDEHGGARVGDDRLRHLHLAIVEVEQRALLINRGGADDGVIDLELADQLRGGGADHGAVGTAHRAASHDHLDARMAVEQHRDIEVVGDDEQILVRGQCGGDLFRRGADVDEERAAVGDARRGGRPDRLLLVSGDEAARLIGEVLHTRGDDRAAMDAGQRALVAEVVEVLADGLCRHLKAPGKVIHRHPAEGAGEVEDFSLAMRQSGHGKTSGKGTYMVRPFAGPVNAAGTVARSNPGQG